VKDNEISESRVKRAARMTGLAAVVATRTATARALSGGNDSDRRTEAATRQQLKAAQSLVKVFSSMRGAAMKVGQTLSAVDLGLVPAEVRPQFQEILATLQAQAEPVSFRAVVKVIEEDLEEKLSHVFADFDEEPIAAASIGQVHRAVLREPAAGGVREVAVKVQYPGIAEAIHADMQNLRLGLRLLSVIAPGIDTVSIADEIRERIFDELDYELEASNHRKMARVYRDHPFIFVPDVVTALSRERVLVSEYVEAKRFAEIKDSPQAERNRIGEVLVRFYLNGPMRHRLLNGDPHPGNSLFPADGRIAFIDFGFFKELGDTEVRQIVASSRATYEHDANALLAVMGEVGALPLDPALAEPFLESYEAIFGWLMSEEPLTADPGRTADMMRRYSKMRDGFGGALELPAEHFVLMRTVFLLIGLAGQLAACNTWLDIAREWLLGQPPATEMGVQEAEFFSGRYQYDTGVPA
jgi:predicted unusual protein kinase regulating ubiquinone biosynthesis (AarF/ABC1/UbiB family)